MKSQIIFSLFLILTSLDGASQNKDVKIIPIDNCSAVVIETNDLTYFKQSSNNKITITSYLFKKGFVWGIKRPAKRPEFKINYSISNDTVYISSPERYSPFTIGISTYTENLETTYEIPENLVVIVKKARKIDINASFKKLIIEESDYIEHCQINKDEIQKFQSRASEKLIINGIIKDKDIEIRGMGNKYIILNSKKIDINIKG